MGERNVACTPKSRRPLGKHRYGLEDNIKMDLPRSGMFRILIAVAQDRDTWLTLVNAIMYLRVPKKVPGTFG